MSDDGFYARAWAPLIAAAEHRAKLIREQSPVCDVCHHLVTTGGFRHASCQPGSLAGLRCTCPRDCTDQVWGDAGTCSEACVPCRIMRGKTYKPL